MLIRSTIGLAVITLLAGQASAHVVFNVDEAKAGAFHTAQLRVMHGCEGQPTDRVRIVMPDGVTRVTPRVVSGWDISVEMRTLDEPILLHGFEVEEVVGALIWSGGSFPDFAYEQFEFRAMLPDEPGRRLDFVVNQGCGDLRLDWDDIAAPDADPWALDEPAPYITLTSKNGD
ncbi:MAG: YcnI family protein [Litorimonas sp.]